jgi:maltooligosyltrehalose trehalohydrolase
MMMNTDVLLRKTGAVIDKNGDAFFRVWAPLASSVAVQINTGEKFEMLQEGEYWTTTIANAKGLRYKYLLNDTEAFPDPASVSQPGGVHDFSEVIDLDHFPWAEQEWKNFPLSDYIIYEIHTGCFSDQGDFAGIEKNWITCWNLE